LAPPPARLVAPPPDAPDPFELVAAVPAAFAPCPERPDLLLGLELAERPRVRLADPDLGLDLDAPELRELAFDAPLAPVLAPVDFARRAASGAAVPFAAAFAADAASRLPVPFLLERSVAVAIETSPVSSWAGLASNPCLGSTRFP
jgi:hypothetical protein